MLSEGNKNNLVLKLVNFSLVMVFGFLAIILFLGCDAKRRIYLSESPEFSKFIGQQYELLEPCYIFKSPGDKTNQLLIGTSKTTQGLPPEVSKNNIKASPYWDIIGIIEKGSIFTIKAVRKDVTIEDSRITFEIIFREDEKLKDTNIDGMFLTTRWPRTEFNPDLARRVNP